MSDLLWQPSAEAVENSQLTEFHRLATQQYGVETGDYNSLYQWSIEKPEDFWRLVYDYTGIVDEHTSQARQG